jgi:cytochrome b6-f complex iron-sulfur subunit
MLAKLGKLPAGDQAETSTESEMAETTEDIGDIEEMSPSRRKMLAKLGKLPSDLPSKSRPSKTAAPARKTPTARSTATGEVHPLVSGKIKRSVKPKLEFKVERRGWLSLIVGWLAFLLGGIPAFATMILRFLFPNVLFEPPQSFKAGYPDDYTIGAIDETYKEKYGVWIGRTDEYIYALSTVCTHLGCTPNWLAGESKFKCPCHGSGFRKTGVHFEGPAPRPLERHWIGLADDGQILVDKNIKFQQEKGQWESENAYLPWT